MTPRPILLDQIATATREECAAVLAAVASRLTEITPEVAPSPDEPDELIDAPEAARILKVSVSTVQHRATVAPLKFARVASLGRGLRFSRKKLVRLSERESGRDTSESEIGLRGINSGRRRRLAAVQQEAT